MADYTIADQLDFTHDDEGVTIHIWFPGERHLRMTWEQWDAMNGEVGKERVSGAFKKALAEPDLRLPAESIVAVVDGNAARGVSHGLVTEKDILLEASPAPAKPKRIRNRKK